MKELINSLITMSSREISELTGKEHRNVIRDIDSLNENYEKLTMLKIEQGYYLHPNTGKQQHKCFNLTKMQTLDLLTGYNTELRIKVNRRWEELEVKTQQPSTIDFSDPDTVLMLAQNWKKEKDLRIKAEEVIQIQAPIVEYHNIVLDSSTAHTITNIAKELGMTAMTLNKKLHDAEIQYRQGDSWFLYSKYQNQDLTKTSTHTRLNSKGGIITRLSTKWTEKGRKFIHELYNEGKLN